MKRNAFMGTILIVLLGGIVLSIFISDTLMGEPPVMPPNCEPIVTENKSELTEVFVRRDGEYCGISSWNTTGEVAGCQYNEKDMIIKCVAEMENMSTVEFR